MISSGYDDYIAHSRQHFEEGLIRSGFVEVDEGWEGAVPHSEGHTTVIVSFPSRFPFQPPRVVPLDREAVPWSWHRELDGSLCLVAEDDHEGLWWTDWIVFLQHVTAWFDQANSGWIGDRPDLDLERYFESSGDRRLYLYDDLAQFRNGFVRFRPSKNSTMRIGRGTRPKKISKHSNDRFGYVVDLGSVDVPPRSWADISSRTAPGVELDRRIRDFRVQIVVLIYKRGSHDGAVALDVTPTVDGGISVKRLRSGADTNEARAARSGLLAPELYECRVAIIGVGALGSFTADMLVRAGIRRLTLIDGDVIMPGNLVRHLVGPDAIGMPKVEAVRTHLLARRDVESDGIVLVEDALTSSEKAAELLRNNDLLVDATADYATTAMLHVVANSLSTQIVSTAIQNKGESYRIDLLPPMKDALPLPSSVLDAVVQAPEVFEVGCGSPISPTPPHVVMEAAAATVRHVIGLLVKRPLHPSGEVRHLPSSAARKSK